MCVYSEILHPIYLNIRTFSYTWGEITERHFSDVQHMGIEAVIIFKDLGKNYLDVKDIINHLKIILLFLVEYYDDFTF